MKVALEPVDSVTVTTLVDNYVDMLLMDQGPAKRPGLPTADTPRVPATVLEEGQTSRRPTGGARLLGDDYRHSRRP